MWPREAAGERPGESPGDRSLGALLARSCSRPIARPAAIATARFSRNEFLAYADSVVWRMQILLKFPQIPVVPCFFVHMHASIHACEYMFVALLDSTIASPFCSCSSETN